MVRVVAEVCRVSGECAEVCLDGLTVLTMSGREDERDDSICLE